MNMRLDTLIRYFRLVKRPKYMTLHHRIWLSCKMRHTIFGIVSIVFVLALTTYAALAGEPAPCDKDLTFRWTSGDPIRLNELHVAAASLKNAPFLRSPEVASVSARPDRGSGSAVTIKFGPASAEVLLAQTSTHIHQQMLIMQGDIVIAAVMVLSPVSDVAVLHVIYEGTELRELIDMLRKGSNDASSESSSCQLSESSPTPPVEAVRPGRIGKATADADDGRTSGTTEKSSLSLFATKIWLIARLVTSPSERRDNRRST